MESLKSFSSRFARILLATNTAKDSELAKILDINQSSIVAARKRQQIPTGWVELIAEKFNINANWLFFGELPMRFGDARDNTELPLTALPVQPDIAEACLRCAKLQRELEEERKERRDMSTELREVSAENRRLWQENGNLRERCARLEEKQVCSNVG